MRNRQKRLTNFDPFLAKAVFKDFAHRRDIGRPTRHENARYFVGLNTRLLKTQLGGLFDIGDIRRNRGFKIGTCQTFLDLDPSLESSALAFDTA
jgi:hypothetical protein